MLLSLLKFLFNKTPFQGQAKYCLYREYSIVFIFLKFLVGLLCFPFYGLSATKKFFVLSFFIVTFCVGLHIFLNAERNGKKDNRN